MVELAALTKKTTPELQEVGSCNQVENLSFCQDQDKPGSWLNCLKIHTQKIKENGLQLVVTNWNAGVMFL